MFRMLSPLPGEAGRRSGSARVNAPRIALCVALHSRLRIPTAAGNTQFTTVPDGRTASSIRTEPEFRISVGSSV